MRDCIKCLRDIMCDTVIMFNRDTDESICMDCYDPEEDIGYEEYKLKEEGKTYGN